MATIKKLLEDHLAGGDAKPAAITNGSTQSFAPKPRGFTAMDDDNGFDVDQDFAKAV